MAVVAQRDGIRVVAFQKCGHTSIINMFLTPANVAIERGNTPLTILNTDQQAKELGAYRGDIAAARTWPEPRVTIAFFRCPLTRAFSAYQHFLIRSPRKQFLDMGFELGMSFPDFCRHLRLVDITLDNHLLPQAQAFEAVRKGIHVVGQLESFDVTWPKLVDYFQIDATKEVVHYNAASYAKTNLHGPHTTDIKQLYRSDYKYWMYETRASLSPVY